jgi:hypothetical protein
LSTFMKDQMEQQSISTIGKIGSLVKDMILNLKMNETHENKMY